MKKRSLVILISILLAAIACGLFAKLGIFGQRYLGICVTDEGTLETLSAGKEFIPAYDSILIDGNPICYDEGQGIVYITQNLENAGWEGALTAGDGMLFFEKNEAFKDKASAIADGTAFGLWYISGDSFFNCSVVFSGMPIMSLNSMWEIGEDEWGGSMELYDRYRVGLEYQATPANYHYRGAYSLKYDKKSYKLNLSDEKLSLCGLRKDDDWILNALYDDIGLIRNATCYRLWNELTTSNSVDGDVTCECEFIELVVNHEYLGVYLLQDRIDKKKTGVTDEDYLYKQKDWVRPTDENDVHGSDYGRAFDVKWPLDAEEDNSTKHVAKEPMKEFMKDTYYPGRSDATYDEICDELYLDNAIDYLIYSMVLYAGDNLYKNSYFGAIHQEDDSYRFYEIPWDLNSTFGILRGYSMETGRAADGDCWNYVGETLYRKNPKEFGALVKERYEELRSSVLSEENMKGVAEEYIDYTVNTGAYGRNLEKYPQFDSGDATYDYEKIWSRDEMMTFIDERMAFLDEYMEKVGNGEVILTDDEE